MRRASLALLFAVLLAITACSSGSQDLDALATDDPGPAAPGADVEGADLGTADVTPPKAGEYVYEFTGLSNTNVPEGTLFVERISKSGNTFTVDISNNKNKNTRRVGYRWEKDRVLQLLNETNINGQRAGCQYDPPLVILHIPIRRESFKRQDVTSPACRGTLDISVTARETVRDTTGKNWPTWVIELRSVSGGRVDEETHWFSTQLGRAVKIETTTDQPGANTTQSRQLLKSHPS